MTRAKRKLVLSAAERRRLYRSTQYNPVSRFVGEIPAQHLVQLQENEGHDQVGAFIHSRRSKKGCEFDEYRQESYDDDVPLRHRWGKAAQKAQQLLPYSPGTKILHPDFGVGTVRKCEGNPENLKLTIQFQQKGVKKILLNYCDIEVVEK